MRRTAVPLAAVALICVLAPGDPAFADKSRTPVTSSVKNLGMSPQELRIRVRALIRPTLGIVEETADRVLREGLEPQARRSALVWKVETTTTLLSALLRNDPIVALADAWGYAFQVERFLEDPEVAARYGALAPKATEAMTQIRASFGGFIATLPPELPREAFENNLRGWAEKNPIVGFLYRRPSMDSALAGILAESKGRGAFAALGSIEETTADMMTRMDLYTMYLPRLARWEAEIAADDLVRGADANMLFADFDRFARASDRIAGAAEGLPDLVAREREAALTALREERLAATHALQGERRAVLDALRGERIATLEEIEAIAKRLLDGSSGPLHEAVREDLADLVQQVEGMRARVIGEAGTTLIGVVDHAFVRAVELLLIAAGLVAAGTFLHSRFLRPR